MSWLGRLIRSWREREPDPAWAPTGVRQIFSGYDQAKPRAAARRALELDAQQRALAQQRAGIGVVITPEMAKRLRDIWDAEDATTADPRKAGR